MNYLTFFEKMRPYGCFHLRHIELMFPGISPNNLARWVKESHLVRLRQGWYSFPEMMSVPEFGRYVATRIYRPAYISLHSALSYYGVIPESVVQYTCVSTHKRMDFDNPFGQYSYHQVQPDMFFGYAPKEIPRTPFFNGGSYLIATPEKAIIDLLYLYPQYADEAEMEGLRFDDDFMLSELNTDRLLEYQNRISSHALTSRINKLRNYFGV